MEFECPDPWPNTRLCPNGLKVHAALCFLGYIILSVEVVGEINWLVFYRHPGYTGWNFVSPQAVEDFHTTKEYLVGLLNDPRYGVNWIHQYFKDHGTLAKADINNQKMRARFGV